MYLGDAEKKGSKKWIAVIVLLVINLAASGFLLFYTFRPECVGADGVLDQARDVQYVLFIGLNDKYTYEQIIPTDEAVDIVNAIFTRHVGGYTMLHARGGWLDEYDVFTEENTLVYMVVGVDEADIITIMDEVLTALNQSSILIERRLTSGFFYRGS